MKLRLIEDVFTEEDLNLTEADGMHVSWGDKVKGAIGSWVNDKAAKGQEETRKINLVKADVDKFIEVLSKNENLKVTTKSDAGDPSSISVYVKPKTTNFQGAVGFLNDTNNGKITSLTLDISSTFNKLVNIQDIKLYNSEIDLVNTSDNDLRKIARECAEKVIESLPDAIENTTFDYADSADVLVEGTLDRWIGSLKQKYDDWKEVHDQNKEQKTAEKDEAKKFKLFVTTFVDELNNLIKDNERLKDYTKISSHGDTVDISFSTPIITAINFKLGKSDDTEFVYGTKFQDSFGIISKESKEPANNTINHILSKENFKTKLALNETKIETSNDEENAGEGEEKTEDRKDLEKRAKELDINFDDNTSDEDLVKLIKAKNQEESNRKAPSAEEVQAKGKEINAKLLKGMTAKNYKLLTGKEPPKEANESLILNEADMIKVIADPDTLTDAWAQSEKADHNRLAAIYLATQLKDSDITKSPNIVKGFEDILDNEHGDFNNSKVKNILKFIQIYHNINSNRYPTRDALNFLKSYNATSILPKIGALSESDLTDDVKKAFNRSLWIAGYEDDVLASKLKKLLNVTTETEEEKVAKINKKAIEDRTLEDNAKLISDLIKNKQIDIKANEWEDLNKKIQDLFKEIAEKSEESE